MNRFRWFLLAAVLAIASAPLLLSLLSVGGGSTFDSPDGRYQLSTWSNHSGEPGGKYTVELFSGASENPIRSISVRVAPTDLTPIMRGNCDAEWNMAAGTVDLLVDDRPELRLYFQPIKETADSDKDGEQTSSARTAAES